MLENLKTMPGDFWVCVAIFNVGFMIVAIIYSVIVFGEICEEVDTTVAKEWAMACLSSTDQRGVTPKTCASTALIVACKRKKVISLF